MKYALFRRKLHENAFHGRAVHVQWRKQTALPRPHNLRRGRGKGHTDNEGNEGEKRKEGKGKFKGEPRPLRNPVSLTGAANKNGTNE